VAAAAAPEVRARRFDPLGRPVEQLDRTCANEPGLFALGLGKHFLAGQHERQQDNAAVHPRQSIASVHQLLHLQLEIAYDKVYSLSSTMKTRVFSGMQPSGNLHIGNYLGALKNWVRIQHDYECIFCIVDLHAITLYQNPLELRAKIAEIAALYLAAGIDPKACSIMVQSAVPAHAELAWMLTCVTPIGWLERMTQYKAKAAKQESVGDGLLQYPVLMAADILLYQAGIVPVGEDQSQHLELTRDVAQRFNSLYGETFVVPGTSLPSVGARIMGLDDPSNKMSKSETAANHGVALLDPPDKIRKIIMRATTDSQPCVDFDSAGPGVLNLLAIYQSFSGASADEVKSVFAGMRYGDLKKRVADMVISHLEPFQERYRRIVSDPGYLDGVLREGAERVAPIANQTVRQVKERMGLYT
jgi:tryptophanyl-tRNA synthetase